MGFDEPRDFGSDQRAAAALVHFLELLSADSRVFGAWKAVYDYLLKQFGEEIANEADRKGLMRQEPYLKPVFLNCLNLAGPALIEPRISSAIVSMRLPPEFGRMLYALVMIHMIEKFTGETLRVRFSPKRREVQTTMAAGDEEALARFLAEYKKITGRKPAADEEIEEIQTCVRWYYEACLKDPPTSKNSLAKQYLEDQLRRGNHLAPDAPRSLVRSRIERARKLLEIDEPPAADSGS